MLYPHKETTDASPKAISGRTSYLRVRLAFHLYPQLIHVLFNALWFGPPFCVTKTSPWPWIGHSVSGLQQQTSRPFRLAFASAPSLTNLTSLAIVTRWPILQKVRHHTSEVGGRKSDAGFFWNRLCRFFFSFRLLTSDL